MCGSFIRSSRNAALLTSSIIKRLIEKTVVEGRDANENERFNFIGARFPKSDIIIVFKLLIF
jgi:hypothetical protein